MLVKNLPTPITCITLFSGWG